MSMSNWLPPADTLRTYAVGVITSYGGALTVMVPALSESDARRQCEAQGAHVVSVSIVPRGKQ